MKVCTPEGLVTIGEGTSISIGAGTHPKDKVSGSSVSNWSVLKRSSMKLELVPEVRKRPVLLLLSKKLALASISCTKAPEDSKRPVLLWSSRELALASMSVTKTPEVCKRPVM